MLETQEQRVFSQSVLRSSWEFFRQSSAAHDDAFRYSAVGSATRPTQSVRFDHHLSAGLRPWGRHRDLFPFTDESKLELSPDLRCIKFFLKIINVRHALPVESLDLVSLLQSGEDIGESLSDDDLLLPLVQPHSK